jgi:hypothetical protein
MVSSPATPIRREAQRLLLKRILCERGVGGVLVLSGAFAQISSPTPAPIDTEGGC